MYAFRDRSDAGKQLAQALQSFAGHAATTVVGLPRGGVPVATEIARTLRLPLDVLVIRKLGAPGQPELAMGAIASGGTVVMNPEVQACFTDQADTVAAITQREQQEMQRREAAYRGVRPALSLKNRTIIIADDGAATGASMRAAVRSLRALGVLRIVVALPVSSPEAQRMLVEEADEVCCLKVPAGFCAVSQWYEDFAQVTDEEVRVLLAQANAKP
jgi:predicted phosphoribosyltransferase